MNAATRRPSIEVVAQRLIASGTCADYRAAMSYLARRPRAKPAAKPQPAPVVRRDPYPADA